MFKQILLSVFLLTALTGCIGEDSVGLEVGNSFENEAFSMGILNNWRRIESDEFVGTLPRETIAVFTDINDPNQNISVVREDLMSPISSLKYAEANIVNIEKKVVNYTKIQSEEAKISETDTIIHVFKGQLTVQNRLLKFIQTYIVRDRKGYVVTGALEPNASEEMVNSIKDTLRTFILK